jgi:hypothetical protein
MRFTGAARGAEYPRRSRAPFAALLVFLAACGGVSDAESLFGDGPAAGEGGGKTTATTGSTSSGEKSSAATGGGDATGSTSTTTTTTSGPATTTATTSTTSGDPGGTGGNGSDSTGPGSGGSDTTSSGMGGGTTDAVIVWCKNAACGAGQICCYHQFNAQNDHCGTAGQCGDNYIELSCNDPSDCPGQTCCGLFDDQAGYQQLACSPTCEGPGAVLMCEGLPAACGDFGECKQSQLLGQGYSYCDFN